MGRLGRDPEFFRFVEGSVSDRILARTKHALTEIATLDNPYLRYILTGNYLAAEDATALPHYLRPENFENIRNISSYFEISLALAVETTALTD